MFFVSSESQVQAEGLVAVTDRLSQCAQYVARLIAFMEFTFV